MYLLISEDTLGMKCVYHKTHALIYWRWRGYFFHCDIINSKKMSPIVSEMFFLCTELLRQREGRSDTNTDIVINFYKILSGNKKPKHHYSFSSPVTNSGNYYERSYIHSQTFCKILCQWFPLSHMKLSSVYLYTELSQLLHCE